MSCITGWEKPGFLPFFKFIGIPLCFFSLISQLPAFYTTGAYPKEIDPQLALIGPSRISIGKPIDLQLVCLGKNGNPCEPTSAPLILCQGPQLPYKPVNPGSVTIPCRRIDNGIFKPETPPIMTKEGYYLFTAKDPAHVFLPFGLPIQVVDKTPEIQIHWGDLHGHSTLSDGARSPEEYYRWARDIARLDVVALTDHNWALDENKIREKKELANKWHESGKFIPFLAFEWAKGAARTPPARGRPDHKHLIFRNVDENLSPWAPWKNTPTVQRLWELLEGREVVAIPHHTGLPHDTFFGTDWSQHNETFERIAEVFSDWGSSEKPEDLYRLPEVEYGNFICDALAKGYHIGMAGGSDTHTSRAGLNTVPHQGHPYPLTALTAIEAPSRTRDEIWKALYNRRCYATSGGRRILMEFHLNNEPMGSIITISGKNHTRRLDILVAGSCKIKEIIIIKNGIRIFAVQGKGWCQKIEWEDADPPSENEDCYYIRAEMEDTSMAWSSPIWINYSAPPIN